MRFWQGVYTNFNILYTYFDIPTQPSNKEMFRKWFVLTARLATPTDLHSEFSKGLEVLVEDDLGHETHALRDHLVDSVLEEVRRFHGNLHPS